MPRRWHSCANRMAQHPTRYLIPVNAVGKSDPSTGTFAENTDLIHTVTLSRIPMIPVLTALACLFLAAFVFELATVNADYFIPARVLVGLGAICFTLFSIVSILESGTSSK